MRASVRQDIIVPTMNVNDAPRIMNSCRTSIEKTDNSIVNDHIVSKYFISLVRRFVFLLPDSMLQALHGDF